MGPIEIVVLTAMTFGGDALGRLSDGRPVFVPFGITGERVRVEILEEKKNFSRSRILDILETSPDRISPRCRHFGICGGCHYQCLDYPHQLEVKQQIVRDQFTRIGKFDELPFSPIVPSPDQWNYRNTVQFHLSKNGKIGYQQAGSNQVVEISECHLPLPALNDAWPALEIEPSSGVERISLREGIGEDLLLILEGKGDKVPEFEVDFPLSAVFMGGGNELQLSGDPYLLMKVKDRDFMVSAGSFFQVNLPQTEKMIDLVLENLVPEAGDVVLDGYCGVGLFSVFIAPKVKQVIGVEISDSACSDYAQNLDVFENVELYVGPAEQILPGLKVKANKVVVDPPRAGIERPALKAILGMAPEKIVYVSCDPSTLARDARLLVDAGYTIKGITPLDLFPQTYHIENIAVFQR